MWFIGVEVEQETSAPPPKKNPGSAPARARVLLALLSLRKKRGILIVYIALSKLNVNVTSLVDRLPILASKRIDCWHCDIEQQAIRKLFLIKQETE